MACAGTASAFVEDESWHKTPGGLDAIAEFNATYDEGQNNNTIDPQLTYGNPRTPNLALGDPFAMNPPASSGLEQTFSPDPMSSLGAYPTDFNNQGMGSPYFHQTIETNPLPQYFPSPLSAVHNLHRRSVSEPPGQPLHQHRPRLPRPQQQSGSAGGGGVVFHRQNHSIGDPVHPPRPMPPQKPTSRSSNRHTRPHPYARPAKQQQHQIYQTHRSQTMGPTSMPPQQQQQMFIPTQSMMQHSPNNMMMMNPMPPPPEASQYSVSRVCTPAPETPSPSLRRQVKVDPSLTGGSRSEGVGGMGNAVVANISVEELRELIFESVRKALGGDVKEEGKGKEGIVEEGGVVVSTEAEV